MTERMRVVTHRELHDGDLDALRRLFDAEYLGSHGEWDPDRPYGYSPADVHVFAVVGSEVVAHVGFQHRTVTVGDAEVVIAGTGGVLVAAGSRGNGLGRRVMIRAQQEMRTDPAIAFGYLGCREEVVPFYESSGWHRIRAVERHVSMRDARAQVTSANAPLLVHPVHAREWPEGDVDLRGTPW